MMVAKKYRQTPSNVRAQKKYYRSSPPYDAKRNASSPRWTEWENLMIRGSYMPDAVIAQQIKRSVKAIQIRRSRLRRQGMIVVR